MHTSSYWIEKLQLKKHPEGGYFKEVYRSDESLPSSALPERYQDSRNLATSIYFLLDGKEFSSFHKIQSDETWHFYQGSSLELFVFEAGGQMMRHLIGQNLDEGESLQLTISRNHWFAARVVDVGSYALVGCTVAPGFHFDDFELADREILLTEFPQHSQLIKELTFGKIS